MRAVEWLTRQGRRLRWVVIDLLHCSYALPTFLRSVRQPDEATAIGVLEGAPRAVRGRANAYRIRLVNDTSTPRVVEVQVLGTASTGATFSVAADRTVAEHTSAELYVGTDWLTRFEFVEPTPGVNPLCVLETTSEIGVCTLTATVLERGVRLDALRITQSLSA